jgi:hypothetical protein
MAITAHIMLFFFCGCAGGGTPITGIGPGTP